MKNKLFYLLIIISLVFQCQQNKKTDSKPDFTDNPYMDAIYNSATADHPDDTSHLPVLSLLEQEFDFGQITEGDTAYHDLKFVNTGNARLLLSNVTSGCGCTTASWPKEFFKPLDTGVIKLMYLSKDKSGIQEKTVTIYANTKPNTTKFSVKVNVIPRKKK